MISDERLEQFAHDKRMCNVTEEIVSMAKELLALRKAHVIPEGWQLVPVEATEEMIEAGDIWCDGLTYLSSAYEAMIGAAPTPQE